MDALIRVPRELVNYDKLSDAELLALVKRRNIHTETSTSRHPFLISASLARQHHLCLLRIDDATRFRFLDLPPELRNHIYEYMLTLDEDGKCNTSILLTCWTIHTEATSILYRTNTFPIKLDCGQVRVYSVLAYAGRKHRETWVWPEFLRKVRSIHFRLAFNRTTADTLSALDSCVFNDGRFITDVFRSLCIFLEGKHQLHNLVVDLSQWPILKEAFQATESPDLFPARLLKQEKFSLSICGAPSPQGLISDTNSGLLRNASSPAEARRTFLLLIQGLPTRVFTMLITWSSQCGFLTDQHYIIKMRGMHTVNAAQINFDSCGYDNAFIMVGKIMWHTKDIGLVWADATEDQKWHLLHFAMELRAALREGRAVANDLKTAAGRARVTADESKATERKARRAAQSSSTVSCKISIAEGEGVNGKVVSIASKTV